MPLSPLSCLLRPLLIFPCRVLVHKLSRYSPLLRSDAPCFEAARSPTFYAVVQGADLFQDAVDESLGCHAVCRTFVDEFDHLPIHRALMRSEQIERRTRRRSDFSEGKLLQVS